MKLFKKKKKKYHGHRHRLVTFKSPYVDPRYIFWYCRDADCNVEIRWVRDNFIWATNRQYLQTKTGYWSRIDGQYREWSN